jgi:hypothetical protein
MKPEPAPVDLHRIPDATLNGDLAGDFHRCPGLTHTSPEPAELATAA